MPAAVERHCIHDSGTYTVRPLGPRWSVHGPWYRSWLHSRPVLPSNSESHAFRHLHTERRGVMYPRGWLRRLVADTVISRDQEEAKKENLHIKHDPSVALEEWSARFKRAERRARRETRDLAFSQSSNAGYSCTDVYQENHYDYSWTTWYSVHTSHPAECGQRKLGTRADRGQSRLYSRSRINSRERCHRSAARYSWEAHTPPPIAPCRVPEPHPLHQSTRVACGAHTPRLSVFGYRRVQKKDLDYNKVFQQKHNAVHMTAVKRI